MKRLLPLLLLPVLALADGPRPITVTNVTRAGEEIATATLAFGAGRAGWTFDLVAMSGLADGGDDFGVLEFCVPKGGWTDAPLQFVTDTRNGYAVPLGGSADSSVTYGGPLARPIRLRVAADSPALLYGKTDSVLVSWAPGVNPDRVLLEAMPKPAKNFWLSSSSADSPYTWNEVSEWTSSTPMPLAMGARLVGTRGTVIVVK